MAAGRATATRTGWAGGRTTARRRLPAARSGAARVLRVLPASMGKPEFPTRGGVHLVLEKQASKVMDSDTVGLPGVNLSPADARWFYDNARRGDVVEVVDSPVGPELDDPGAADGNLSFADWKTPA